MVSHAPFLDTCLHREGEGGEEKGEGGEEKGEGGEEKGEGGEDGEGRGWEKESRRFEGSVYTHMLMIQQRVYAGCGSH